MDISNTFQSCVVQSPVKNKSRARNLFEKEEFSRVFFDELSEKQKERRERKGKQFVA